MRILRTSAVAVLAWLAVAQPALAQPFLTDQVGNAQLRASYFAATWAPPPGQSWSTLQGHLIDVYRATIDDGTITLGATLAANSAPRTALGPSSSQTLYIRHVAGTVAADTDLGTPDKQLAVEVALPWDKAPTIFTYPLVLAYDVEVANLYATCGAVYGCTVKHTILVLPKRAAIAIGGIERSVPTLFYRQTKYFDLASAGISPFAEWESISLDGVAMTKVPFMTNYGIPPALQWYRHPVRPGDATQSGDPLPPTGLVIPSSNESIEKFLDCGGGGCGTHQARIGLGESAIPTGLHTLTLHTRPYASGTYGYFQTQADVGAGLADDTSDLTTQFIVFDPQMQVTPTEAGPGQTITVTGSGFAPNSQVRFRAGLESYSRYAVIGTARTDVTGSFEAHPTLPPASDAFFTDVIRFGAWVGSLQVDVDDAQFLADHFGGVPQYDSSPMTYLPVATATTTTTIPTGVTTTTLPGGEPGDVGLDDTPACAAVPVPAKAVQKFDSADQGLDFVQQMILEAAARKAIRKAIGKADAALVGARKLMNRARKKGVIPESCAAEAFDLIDGLRQRAKEAKQSLKN
jgi:hypothetical protein